MATPAAYYAAFATWLASHGYRTLTFDLRGTESVAAMKAEDADVLRWFGDMADALDHVLEEAELSGGLPVSWVGHSLGGQAVPFVDHSRLDRIVNVASGTGYWRLNPPAIRWRAPLLWRGIAPVASRVAGYYPGRRLGVLDNVPAGVMRQWGRWCMHEDYLGVDVPHADERFAEVTTPMTVLSFTDDALMSEASIADLHDRYATPTRSASATARPSSRSTGWATTASSAPATRTSGTSWSCRTSLVEPTTQDRRRSGTSGDDRCRRCVHEA